MLNIKSLLLGNYRTITDTRRINLAPLTILTGPDYAGRSASSTLVSLLQGMNTSKLPLKICLDHSRAEGGPDMIKGRRPRNRKMVAGFGIYNIILGEEVDISLSFERDGNFDAKVTGMTISGKKGILFDFCFEENRISSDVGIAALLEKMKDTKIQESGYREIERIFREIRASSGSYREKADNNTDSSNINIFHIDNDLKRKNLIGCLNERNVSVEEYERLHYLFGKNDMANSGETGNEVIMNNIRKALSEFDQNDILLNDTLVKGILHIPSEELGDIRLKKFIKDEFPALYDCLLLLNDPALIPRIVNLLRSKDYFAWEHAYAESDITTTRNAGNCSLQKELSDSIENHFQVTFSECALFTSVTELNATREGFIQVYNRYRNLKDLVVFSRLVLEKLLSDISDDLCRTFSLPVPCRFKGLTVDFSHPMHGLLKRYTELRRKDKFLKRWIRRFGIGEELNIEIPLIGMGYLPLLKRKDENIPLSSQGNGANNLVKLLLEMVIATSPCNMPDYKDEVRNYPGTIMIEEPETNLNPAWQSKLADLFADAGKQLGLHFLLETQSNYLIKKLQYLVATGQVESKDVIIYYFSTGGVKEIRIEADGSFSAAFGQGYFDEDDMPVEIFRLKKTGKN